MTTRQHLGLVERTMLLRQINHDVHTWDKDGKRQDSITIKTQA